MVRRIDPRYSNTLLDANALDKTGGPTDAAVDAILELDDVTIMLPHSVMSELEHPHTPAEVRRRARGLIFTQPVSLTPGEIEMHARIRELLRGNAKPGKHDSDAYHLVESHKYGGAFSLPMMRAFSQSATRL
jgi:hypothetical protein